MKKKDTILDQINDKIPAPLKDLLPLVSNLITILASMFSLIVMISNWIVGDFSASGTWKNYLITALFVIILTISFRAVKQKAEHNRVLSSEDEKYQMIIHDLNEKHQLERGIVSQKYYQLLHDYRNVINDLEYNYKKGLLTEEQLTVIVTKFLENALDYLVDTLSQLSGQDVSGCVKAIIGGNCDRISYEDAKVNTFVRSHNTSPARRSLDQKDEEGVLLCENTDFMDIVAEDRDKCNSVFYQPNLKVYAEQLKEIGKTYKNSTPHWDQYYIGTIVAPIRIASKRLFYLDKTSSKKRKSKNRKKKSVYYTLGFLCVDSLNENTFGLDQKDNYTYIVKSYAATMFNVLSKNQFYLMRLHEKTKEASQASKT